MSIFIHFFVLIIYKADMHCFKNIY